MKITYSWLKEYVDFPWDWPELVERLTMSGLEIEGVEDLAAQLDGVVVGHVLERQPHPDADRLSVCRVDVGDAVHTVVCGAPNVAAGQKVAVALPGSRLPNGMEIKKAVIRGVESSGMICAEDELGLGDDHAGTMVLDESLTPGTSFAASAGLDEVMLDFEVTPNRPDCLSLWGIAREVRALTGAELRMPACEVTESGPPAAASVAIDIEDAQGCPRYVGRVVRNVRIGPSPEWLQRRLQAVGQRPINNVVDVTNYVLQELGQPLHAFDLAKLADDRIIVRRARPGEKMESLDEIERELTEEILVIADGRKAVALAGIMGGADSEVSAATTDILLESAYFDPTRVRRGKSLLEMQTEAAMRFERGADWEMAPVAIDRAARLIAELAGGDVAPERLDLFPNPPQLPHPSARISRVNQLLATDLDGAAICHTLELLGCQVEQEGDLLQVVPPSYRPDLLREADLIEEVGRIYGYDRIEGSQQASPAWLKPLEPHLALQREMRHTLSGLGFDEVASNTIVERKWLELSGEKGAVELANPPTENQAVLRTTLIPSLLDIARRNFNQRAASVAVFELGRCFQQLPDAPEHREYTCLSGLWSGQYAVSPWQADRREVDFFDLKGSLEALLVDVDLCFESATFSSLRSGRSARVLVDGRPCGYLGEVKPSLCSSFAIERPVYIFELNFQTLVETRAERASDFVPLAKYPPIERDLAVLLREDVSSAEVVEQIGATAPRLIESVALFDLYQGDQIPAGQKSLAFSIRLRAPDKTLKDRQADALIDQILKRLGDRFGAQLR